MLVPSLMSFGIATVTAWASINTEEEVCQAALGLVSVLSIILSLFFAPWLIKLLVIVIPLLLEKFKPFSPRRS